MSHARTRKAAVRGARARSVGAGSVGAGSVGGGVVGAGTVGVTAVGAVVAGGLLLAGLLHLLWAWTTWPLGGPEDFARLVVGVPVDRLPSPGLTALVAGLLMAAAQVVGAASGIWRSVGPRWVARWGVAAVAVVLLLRGGGGLVADLSAPSYAPADFVRLDRILYSPLCLLLGMGAGWVFVRGRRLTA